MQYLTLDLRITDEGGIYRARLISHTGGEATSAFVLPTLDTEPALLLHQMQTATLEERQSLGTELFDALFSGHIRDLYQRSCSLAQTQNARIRIRLNLTDVPELAQIPWEYLYDSTQNRFLALSVETTFVRYLDLVQTAEPLVVQPPLRILVIIANPSDFEPLAVEQEWQNLKKSLANLISEGLVDLQRLDTATLPELQRTLRKSHVHILHFIGHGLFDGQSQEGLLIFENKHEQGVPVAGEQLGTILDNHPVLRLAVLNACTGGQSSESDAFRGVAQQLVHKGIPAVIAMQDVITDAAASVFSHEFYAALADAYPVDSALAEARVAMTTQDSGGEWGIPVLYMRAPDGAIFAPKVDDGADHAETTVRWHPLGAAWIGAGLLGVVLLAGLGAILLQGNPLLQAAIAAMLGLATFLVGFFGLQGDKTLLPKLSHRIGTRRSAQIVMGLLLAAGLAGWATIGADAWQQGVCDPVLGCKEAGERWFAVGEWEIAVAGEPSPIDQLLASSTRRILYEKLSLIKELRGISTDSPQVSDQVKASLDYWIAGDYQRFNRIVLTAEVTGPGGVFYHNSSVEGPAEIDDLESEICILDLQNELAFRILDALAIEVNDEFRQSIASVPTSSCEALILNNDAVSWALEGEYYRAELSLRDALLLDPEYPDAHSNLGWVLRRQGDLEGALKEYEAAADLDPLNPVNHFNLGLAYELDGRFEESITKYKKAIELDPAFYQAFNNLGFTYLQMGELELAAEVLSQGLRISDYRFLRKNLGRVYLEQGNAAAAVDQFQTALQLSESEPFPEAQYYLAVAFEELGMRDEACNALQQYELVADFDSAERVQAATDLTGAIACR